MSVFFLILGLILFVSLVVVHEWGHYIAARRADVDVEEFGIGFPPRAWSKKLKNKTLFSLNWLPLGGFVKLKGEHDSDRAPHSYGAASLGNKIKIMTAGVVMNLLVAILMFMIIALIGMPKLFDNQFIVASDAKVVNQSVMVGYIEEDSPAEKAGLKKGDQIISIGQTNRHEYVSKSENLPQITKNNAGQTVVIEYKRAGQTGFATVNLRTSEEVENSKNSDNPKGYLGVVPADYEVRRSTWSAPIVAVGLTGQITKMTFEGLGNAIGNLAKGDGKQASEQVSGPVGIFVLLKDGSILGLSFILLVIAIISLTLAIMNILPIPALDGGRLFVTLIFRIMNKPLTKQTEEIINGVGFAFLMILIVLITVVDVKKFF